MIRLIDFADFIQSLARGDHGMTPGEIADKLEMFARQLTDAAARVRRMAGGPYVARDGMGDRVRIQAVGPDGMVKVDRRHGNWN